MDGEEQIRDQQLRSSGLEKQIGLRAVYLMDEREMQAQERNLREPKVEGRFGCTKEDGGRSDCSQSDARAKSPRGKVISCRL
jgi:hypothetical protein